MVKPEEAQDVLKMGSILVAGEKQYPGVSVILFNIGKTGDIEETFKQVKKSRVGGHKIAVLVEVVNKEMEKAAVKAAESADFLIAVTPDWKVIPLENMIAELQQSGVRVLAGVRNATEAKIAAEALEIGTAGVFLEAKDQDISEIKKIIAVFESLALERIEFVPATVKTVKPVGSGDRACVDTTSLMIMGEGMLVGSQASGMFLVHSETLASEFVETRPFRVNAGAVHAYIRLPNGKTKYMSELKAGDEVLIVNHNGDGKTGVVGRVKIERRPLLLVEAETGGEVFKTLLQNAETVNLVCKDGKPISVAKLKPNDEILIHIEKAGRHFGMKVEETLVER